MMTAPARAHTDDHSKPTTVGSTIPGVVIIGSPLIILALGSVLILIVHAGITQTAEDMAAERLVRETEILHAAITELTDHTGSVLDHFVYELDQVPADDPLALAEEMRTIIRDDPIAVSLTLARADGDRYVLRTDAAGAIGFTARSAGVLTEYRYRDHRWHAHRRLATGLGFSESAWHGEVRAENHHLTWSGPLRTEDGSFGMAAAKLLRDDDGLVDAVVALEISFDSFATLIDRLWAQQSGSAFVTTGTGFLVAHPDYYGHQLAALAATGQLPHARALGDPRLAEWYRQVSDQRDGFVLTDDAGGYGVSRPLRLGGITLLIGATTPREPYLAVARAVRNQALLIGIPAVLLATATAIFLMIHLHRRHRSEDRARRLIAEAEATVQDLGSYRLIERIGSGGMGDVWRAEHSLLARPTAIKLIRAEHALAGAHGDEYIARFCREARIMANLRSVHTVDVYDFGVTDDGRFYLAMELLDGLDLRTLVTSQGPQPLGRIVHLLTQVCDSLAEAHDMDLVHRDLKPANIFCSRQADSLDLVKVFDFGLVVDHRGGEAHLTQVGQIVGSPRYMAPEQVRGEAVDGRADLYSLGCVAYFLLTGVDPFAAPTIEEIAAKQVHEDPPPPSTHVPVPPEVDELIMACLNKDPARRPQDARQLRARLRSLPIPQDQRWSEIHVRSWWQQWSEQRTQDRERAESTVGLLRIRRAGQIEATRHHESSSTRSVRSSA